MNKHKIYENNFKLLKLVGVYQMVDPHCRKIFGFNIYHFLNIVLIIFTTSMTVLGLSGFIYKPHNHNNSYGDIIFIIFYAISMVIGNLKIILIIYKAREIWSMMEVTDESFLSNTFYKKNYYKIVNCCGLLSKLFNLYFICLIFTLTLYAIVPIVLNTSYINSTTQNTETIKKINTINFKYPFTAETYNAFFKIFYASECIMLIYTGFGVFALDLFTVTILMIISIQYKLIASAFEALEHKVENEDKFLNDEQFLEQFISIVSDSQIISKKLKLCFNVIRPISIVQLISDSTGMICMPYLIAVYFEEYGSLFNLETMKFTCTMFMAVIQSFINCSLFQLVNDRRDSVNFGLYSCDWTAMDIHMKKLILFTMQINNSNRLKMNITPNRSIDLPLLSKIIRLSYRISSLMINTNVKNLKHQ